MGKVLHASLCARAREKKALGIYSVVCPFVPTPRVFKTWGGATGGWFDFEAMSREPGVPKSYVLDALANLGAELWNLLQDLGVEHAEALTASRVTDAAPLTIGPVRFALV